MSHRLQQAVALTATMAGAQAKMEKMEKMDKKMDKMEMKDEIAKMPWGPGPDFLPKGAKMHVVSGNPGAAGPFVLHLMFPQRLHRQAAHASGG